MAHAPSAASAVVLQRSLVQTQGQAPAGLSQLDDPRALQSIERWCEQGENFYFYAISSTGVHTSFETSRQALLTERIELIARMSAARHAALHLSLQVDESMRELIKPIMSAHVVELAQLRSHDGLREHVGVTVQRPVASSSTVERLLVIHVPRSTVESHDLASFLLALDSQVSTGKALAQNWMRLRVSFDGWEEGAEEGGTVDHLNPCVRTFLRSAMELAPWWLALVHPAEYVKWFGCLAKAQPVPSRTVNAAYNFIADAVRPFTAIGALEAELLLDCSGISPDERRDEMTYALNTMAANLVVGVDLTKLDAQRSAALQLGLRNA